MPTSPRIRSIALSVIATAVAHGGPAHAIDIEKLVMPGPVIEAHADVEGECRQCHSPFDRGAEKGLCLACHEDIALDLEARSGYHGRHQSIASSSCRSCHPEHKGRAADVTGLDPETFDHDLTDHPLTGLHARVPCADCHPADRKHRDTASDCIECHRTDDPHAGKLGDDCKSCHDPAGWRETRFDHSATDFPLEGGHEAVACALCHTDDRYKETPSQCAACHVVDDVHRGRFGRLCASCHVASSWATTGFDHNRGTDFPLRGAHTSTKCAQCHRVPTSKSKKRHPNAGAGPVAGSRCVDCHSAEDEHRGSFGTRCGACHGSIRWRDIRFDHARDAKLALEGAHKDLSCRRCHTGKLDDSRSDASCYACHVADDVHAGQEGRSCELCHGSASWSQQVRFDHDLASFPLLGLHAVASCEACHADSRFKNAPEDCRSCHEADDAHDGALGTSCEECHDPNGWGRWRFDHDTETDFALKGGHVGLPCKACHDTPAIGRVRASSGCDSCHSAEDPHAGSFGSRCGDCHVEEGWEKLRMGR